MKKILAIAALSVLSSMSFANSSTTTQQSPSQQNNTNGYTQPYYDCNAIPIEAKKEMNNAFKNCLSQKNNSKVCTNPSNSPTFCQSIVIPMFCKIVMPGQKTNSVINTTPIKK